MTNPDRIAPPPLEPPPPPVPPTFSAGMLIVGLVVSLPLGAIANVVADLAGSSTNSKPAAGAIGLIPGLIFIGLSFLAKRNRGFGTGLLVGGCIVALVGGACGVAMTPFNIR